MTETTYLLDEYVATKPGTPYRLFPFGAIYKNGRRREITPELASQFKLPHFKPPIKLGSHDDPTPAGGHIIGLEVRPDGLYAIPEWNEKGEQAMEEGAYRYHSPEVIWDDGAIEDPTTGAMMSGPIVLGDALLHTPHLGEATAFYTVHVEEKMMEETINIPKNFWDKYVAPLFAREPERVEVEKVVEPEDYSAIKQERDEFKQRLEQIEAERKTRELKDGLIATLQDKEQFGMSYVSLDAAQEAADMLASMSEAQREWVLRNFKAFIAQIDESKLTGERGSDKPSSVHSDDPMAAFNAAVLDLAKEKGILYQAAFEQIKKEQPDLFKAAFKK